jgi:hypothetical protein
MGQVEGYIRVAPVEPAATASRAQSMSSPHPRPYYYLENFQTALAWLRQRYADLLNDEERAFMRAFEALPTASSALLVRMIMRKGPLFRTGKLEYAEIGCPRAAAAPLIALGWLDEQPLLGVAEVFALMRKAEIAAAFRLTARARAVPKDELMAALASTFVERRTFEAWCPGAREIVYRVCVLDVCERLRLMFFGNFDQTWSEFVLADLGIFNYEKVAVPASARAFQRREHIDDFHAIYQCRERFRREEPGTEILAAVPAPITDNAWLESRRAKLLFRIGQRYEKQGDLDAALGVYGDCAYPGARVRAVRVLERQDRWEDAAALAARAEQSPEDEVERQRIARIVPRLRRRLGVAEAACRRPSGWLTFELHVPATDEDQRVELATSAFLTEPDAPVHYVENALINSLFGLLCWDVVFLPLPGAFFHEFHSAPADLYAPDFYRRREREFAACFAQLVSGAYRETIRRNFVRKSGIQSAFVSWGWLTEELLDVALECLPPEHLEYCFHRILRDVKANRAGFPDLIQFWPRERRYRMIEVKGPGDRLQDNQIRWLDYCASHGMPVSVCHVRWAEAGTQ